MIILNEEQEINDLILSKTDYIKKIGQQINKIVRYNYHVKHMLDEDNYNFTVNWLNTHNETFLETVYQGIIESNIKSAKKFPLHKLDSIKITKREFNTIKDVNDIRMEKVLFVMLCIAKLQKETKGYQNGMFVWDLVDIFKMARISVPKDMRAPMVHSLMNDGYIKMPKRVDATAMYITFMSDDDIAFEVDKIDCKELAYLYMLKTGHRKIVRCKKCGRLIKTSLKYDGYCKNCFDNVDNDKVTIRCMNCGTSIVISQFDSKTCRCDICQHEEDKKIKRNWWNNNKN